MALLLILAICQQEDDRRAPRIRLTFPRCDAFDLTEEQFISNFRLGKKQAYHLIHELNPFLEPKTTRKTALTTDIKVLCALNFFAFGCYQKKIGNDYLIGISQSSVSNCIHAIADAMSKNLLSKYVQFPNEKRMQDVLKQEFFEYSGVSGVLGAIDCTHVAIIAPQDDGFHNERNYVNRKGWHSMNVQLVCDMNMRITNVNARYPGCSHDAFIWQSCNLKAAFDSGSKIHGKGWLIGDSGYPQGPYLHTPYTTFSPGSPQEEYNNCHARGRCVIERCNGVLKNRFRCLLKHRTLHYSPPIAARIINSCVILHNICIEANLTWEDIDLPEDDELFNTMDA